jgi:hypothetical protein
MDLQDNAGGDEDRKRPQKADIPLASAELT